MNIREHIELHAGFQDHFETFNVVSPIPTNHPPSLKNAKPVQQPEEIYKSARDKKRRRKKNRRKPGDMAYTMRKALNQGHSSMVNHTKVDPNLWNPSQIADI